MHHVTWRVFLYLVVVVANKRDTNRAGGLTEKNILPVYFVSAVEKKNASVGKHLCVAGVYRSLEFRIILKARFWVDSICIESDWGML